MNFNSCLTQLILFYLIITVLNQILGFQINCPAEGIFTYIIPESSCQEYYTCRDGRLEIYICSNDTMYNLQTQTCELSGSCYDIICTGRINGNYPDSVHNCSRFYNCVGGELMSVTGCPSNTNFDGFECVNSTIECPFISKSSALVYYKENLCEGKSDGYHLKTNDNCKDFILCKSGFEIGEYECVEGKVFNGTNCVKDTGEICKSFCYDKKDGMYYDAETDCQEYIKCSNFKMKFRKRCSVGSVFNGDNCVPEPFFKCPNRNICKHLNNGFHTDYESSCKEYYYCLNSQLIAKKKCPDNYLFNGSECVANDLFLCNYGVNNCNKTNGYYTEEESNCRSYYYCLKNNKLIYVCPENKVWNGTDCVNNNQYICPYDKNNDCDNFNDGFHYSENSKSEFIHCLNGVKITTIMCDTSKFFNGEICQNLINEKNFFNTNQIDFAH